jgi:uncharacterized membrane-anchored protein YitT (DUF2179 family)
MKHKLQSIYEYILPIFAGFLYAVAIKYFIRPTEIIMTGTEGISLATSYYFNSELLFVILYSIFQLILLIFSFIKIGSRFSIKTLISVSAVSIFILILPMIKFGSPEPENERLVLVIFGSIIAGVAKAISLKNRGSVGDEDIIAVYLSEKLRKPVGKTIIMAGIISMTYGLILSYLKTSSITHVANTLIYTTIFLFISSETVNSIYKRYRYSQITINVNNIDLVASLIKEVLPERSFTISNVIGGHAGLSRKQISLILSQEELPTLLNSLKHIEEKYFIHYNQVDGILGRFPFNNFSEGNARIKSK